MKGKCTMRCYQTMYLDSAFTSGIVVAKNGNGGIYITGI